jgi:hypothetical protein
MRTVARILVLLNVLNFLCCNIAYGDDIGPPLHLPKGATKVQPTALSPAEKNNILSYIPQGYQAAEGFKIDLTNDSKDEIVVFYDNMSTASSMATIASRCMILAPNGNSYSKQPVLNASNNTEADFGHSHAPPLFYKLNGKTIIRVKTYYRGTTSFSDIYWDGKRFLERGIRH